MKWQRCCAIFWKRRAIPQSTAQTEKAPWLPLIKAAQGLSFSILCCRGLTASGFAESANTPIIIVSAKTEKDDKLNGLILGADDYIEKPYDIDILLAKIKGIFTRRYQSDVISDGFLKIDKSKRIAFKENTPLDLTQKEFDLLLLLAENSGKTLSKDYLFNQIWGFDSFSEPQTLTVHIKWLRQKIEADPKKPKHIVTVWGVGYRYER